MSIEISGPPYDYCLPGVQCLQCFADKKSPFTLYFALSGILKGGASAPGDAWPPNGLWPVDVAAPCHWNDLGNGNEFFYDQRIGWSIVKVRNAALVEVFKSVGRPPCTMFYKNDYQDSVNDNYYGGFCAIGYIPPAGNESFEEVAKLLNILPEPGLYCTTRAKSETETVYAYQQKRDRTNIKILFEET